MCSDNARVTSKRDKEQSTASSVTDVLITFSRSQENAEPEIRIFLQNGLKGLTPQKQ